MKLYWLIWGNTSEGFTIDNMKKKTGLNGFVYNCTVDYSIDVSDIVDIHKYLMNDQIYLTSFYCIIKF